MKSTSSINWIAISLLGMTSACGGSTATPLDKTFDVVLRASSDEGEPVQGATFVHGESSLGKTDVAGRVATKIQGVDGQTLAVVTTCPDGYLAPEQSAQLRLTEVRKLDSNAPATIELDVVCTRKMRDIVLVVRTNQAPSLPVEVSGKSIGSTDSNGQAHYHVQLDRSVGRLSVSLDTGAAPKLRPQNPSRVFELEGRDAVLLFDQSFAAERPAPPTRRLVATKKRVEEPPARPIPYRIDSGTRHAF